MRRLKMFCPKAEALPVLTIVPRAEFVGRPVVPEFSNHFLGGPGL
jgi:hypothetical protein